MLNPSVIPSRAMDLALESPHRYVAELRARTPRGHRVLWQDDVTADLAALATEAVVRAVLADTLAPEDAERVALQIAPRLAHGAMVAAVELDVRLGGESLGTQSFDSGPWARQAARAVEQLRTDGSLGADEPAYLSVEVLEAGAPIRVELPPLALPAIADRSLEACGVRTLGPEPLTPDRPVLVNARMVEEIVGWTYDAGPVEIGGAVLGCVVRLPSPLPGTSTPLVTVLSAGVLDPRHQGEINRVAFNPEGLAAAAEMADLRGLGEVVLTVFHSHGWGTACGNCNESATCALAECTQLSGDDYQVMETLFPSKASLMPVAGRKRGAGGRRPVLEVHAWRGGKLIPIRYGTYQD